MEFYFSIIAGLLSLIAGGIAENKHVKRLLRRILRLPEQPEETYGQKLKRLSDTLAKSSAEVDTVFKELTQTAKEREAAVEQLGQELAAMQDKEKELEDRIKHLKDVPIPIVDRLAEITSIGERRSARRDYFLFGAGVLVSTGIAIILKLLGLG